MFDDIQIAFHDRSVLMVGVHGLGVGFCAHSLPKWVWLTVPKTISIFEGRPFNRPYMFDNVGMCFKACDPIKI